MSGVHTTDLAVGQLPADLLTAELTDQPAVVAFLRQLAHRRDVPISVPLAFNAFAFAYNLSTGSYDRAVLDLDRLPTVSADTTIDALPVGALAQLATGGAPQAFEVIFRHAEHEALQPDGTCPPWLSGAPVGAYAPGSTNETGELRIRERLVIDVTALGDGTPERLRRLTGRVISDDQHVVVHAGYVDAGQAELDDTRLYASYLLRRHRDDLRRILAPLGPVDEDAALASTLHATLDVLTALLDAAGLLRWREQYLHPDTYDRWLASDGVARVVEPADVDRFYRTVARDCLPVQRRYVTRAARPAYFAIGPTLRAAVRDNADPERTAAGLRGPRYATAVACAQLYLSQQLTDMHGGIVDVDGAEVHVRLDDAWQGGGVWRAHVAARNELLDPVDLPLALGWLTALEPATVYMPRQRGRYDGADGNPNVAAPVPGADAPEQAAPAADAASPDAVAGTSQDSQAPVEPEPEEEPDGPDAPPPMNSWVDDTTLGWRFVLGPRHDRAGTVPLTPKVAEAMRQAFDAGSVLHLDLTHQGGDLAAEQRRQPVTFDGRRLHGVRWPDGFFYGIRLTASWSTDSYQITVASTALHVPLDVDGIPLDYEFDAEMVMRYLLGPVDLNADADALCAPVLRALVRRNGRLAPDRGSNALSVPLRELTDAVRAHARTTRQPEPTTAQVCQAVEGALSDTGAVRLYWAVLLTRDDGDGLWLAPRWPRPCHPDWYEEPTTSELVAGDPAIVLSLHPTPADRPSREPEFSSGVPSNAEEFLRRGHLRRLPRGQTPQQRHLAIAYAKAMGWDPRTLDPRITFVSESHVRR